MRCSPKPVRDGRRAFGAESIGKTVGKQAACMKSACVSVVPTRGETNCYFERAQILRSTEELIVPVLANQIQKRLRIFHNLPETWAQPILK